MNSVIEIESLSHPGVEIFSTLTESQLRNRLEQDKGIFIAESPKVIRVALSQWETEGRKADSSYEPLALLCERRHIDGDAADIIEQCQPKEGEEKIKRNFHVYTGTRELLTQLTGYTLTRGVLCAMRRPKPRFVEDICKNAHRIAIIDGVVDTTNIGAIFRSAAALGIEAILVTPNSCDPLNRRAIRVSMGSVFLIPWTWTNISIDHRTEDNYQETLHKIGFKTVAMALTDRSVAIDDPSLMAESRLAIILGTEGDGLPHDTIIKADYTARIPMYNKVDSLNVAAASAVAFWQLRKH